MKMKKRNLIKTGIGLSMTLCAAAFLMTGCSNDNEAATSEKDGRVALQVSSGIQTRAVDNRWEESDVIGIYMLKDITVDTYANVPYQLTEVASGKFAPQDEPIYLPADGTKRDFIACYPHKQLEENTIYAIDLSVQDEQNKIDFMMADKVTGKSREDAAVAFNFKHKLAKVVLTIKTGKDFDGTGQELEQLQAVTLTNQQTKGTYDILNGTDVAGTSAAGEIALKVNKADVTNCTAEGIVFPSESYTGMKFQFDMGDVYGAYEWSLEGSSSVRFEAGKKYKYDITINKTGLEVTSTITDWEPGNGDGESGSAE